MGVTTKYEAKDFRTKRWSGGTTTELFIYPNGASLNNLDFDFRISKATIEVKKSTFTPLPGVIRTFTLLEGKTVLKHEGHYQLEMEPNKVDQFLGDWTTTSDGYCTPFNLMTMNQCTGNLQAFNIKNSESVELNSNCDFFLIYCNKGSLTVDIQKQNKLSENELIVLSQLASNAIQLHAITNCHIVVVHIKLNEKEAVQA